jgi:hypothetical protein
LTVYRTSVPPLWNIWPPRGSLVSTLIRLPLELSRISIRSSASFAASGDPARALFNATISTVFPSEGWTSIRPFTFLTSTRPPGASW